MLSFSLSALPHGAAPRPRRSAAMLGLLATLLLLLLAAAPAHASEVTTVTTKTLVSWVTLANLTQQGGSALTLGHDDRFDGIVFGERTAGKWMAGSDFWNRTPADQSAYPAETAAPATLVQMAIVYEGTSVTLYRNAVRYAAYTVAAQETYSKNLYATIGIRHQGAGGDPFGGTIDDARIYDVALTPQQLAALVPNQLSSPAPWAWWTFENGQATDVQGRFDSTELLNGATIQNGRLILDGMDDCMLAQQVTNSEQSPIHYRPRVGVFADPIPFFWRGTYHVFHLRGGLGKVPWEHIASNDLVHWQEFPRVLVSDGAADGPDGMHMFTGSVTEKDGTFHIFYTGHNPNNPAGLEFVRHATSPDLVNWTKDPSFQLGPDGTVYANTPQNRNWRDPYVFWCEEEQQFWMLVIANSAATGQAVQGLLTSPDLIHWTAQQPMAGAEGQECPDLFKIGDYYYLIGGAHYASSLNLRGPYTRPANNSVIDSPGVYAGKRQFDGQRHIWTGWAWDTSDKTDDDTVTWGGNQCLPRELVGGANGELFCKPAAEIPALYNHTLFDLQSDADRVKLSAGATARQLPPAAERDGQKDAAQDIALPWSLALEQPNYLLEMQVEIGAGAVFQIMMREQAATGEGYFLNINRDQQQVALGSRDNNDKAFTWSRTCELPAGQPVKIQAFVQGTMLECFVNDRYAFTRRIYNFTQGNLGLKSIGGTTQINSMTLKTIETTTTSVSTAHYANY